MVEAFNTIKIFLKCNEQYLLLPVISYLDLLTLLFKGYFMRTITIGIRMSKVSESSKTHIYSLTPLYLKIKV